MKKYISLIAVTTTAVAVAVIVSGGFFLDSATTDAIFAAALFVLILVMACHKVLSRKFLTAGIVLLLIGLFLRLVWGIGAYEWSLDTLGTGTWTLMDALFYDNQAQQLAQSSSGYLSFSKVLTPNPGYVYFLALVYKVFGHSIPLAVGINGFLGCLVCLIVYDLARRLYAKEIVAQLAYVLCVFYPPLIYYQGLLLKDTLITFLVVLITWCLIRFLSCHSFLARWKYVGIIIASFVPLFTLRWVYALLMGPIVIWVFVRQKSKHFVSKLLFLVILLVFSTYLVPLVQYTIKSSVWEHAALAAANLSEKTGDVDRWVKKHPDSFYRFVAGGLFSRWYAIPIAFVFSLITPFPPWREKLFIHWPWIFLLPFVLQGAVKSIRNNGAHRIIVVIVSTLLMAYVIGYGGGATARYRIPFTPLMMMFAGVGLYQFKYVKKRTFFWIWLAIYFSGCIFYIALRYNEMKLVIFTTIYVLLIAIFQHLWSCYRASFRLHLKDE